MIIRPRTTVKRHKTLKCAIRTVLHMLKHSISSEFKRQYKHVYLCIQVVPNGKFEVRKLILEIDGADYALCKIHLDKYQGKHVGRLISNQLASLIPTPLAKRCVLLTYTKNP